MILKRNFNPLKVFLYVWRETLISLMLSTAVYVAFVHFELKFLAFPIAPLTILGTAIAIFLAFRNNTSYTRWWEARTLWANLASNSRIFTRQLIANADTALSLGKGGDASTVQSYKREMIYRQIAFAHALRLHLRTQSTWSDLLPFLNSDEYTELLSKSNKPNWLLQTQGKRIKDGIRMEILGAFDNITLEPQLSAFNNWQTLCERLKHTPVLRQYDYFSRTFVWVFIALFPFSLIEMFKSLPLMVIPFSVLLAFVFAMVQRVGEVNEEPFENKIQDVPMTAICNQIERDLRETWGIKTSNTYQYGTFAKRKTEDDVISRNFIYLYPKASFYPYIMIWLERSFRRGIDFRHQEGIGASYVLFTEESYRLKLSLTLTRENSTFKTGRSLATTRLTARLLGKHVLFDGNLRVRYELWIQPSLEASKNVRAHIDGVLEAPLSKHLSLLASLNFTRESVVLPGIRENDALVLFGLSLLY